jgi:hypothetical protein
MEFVFLLPDRQVQGAQFFAAPGIVDQLSIMRFHGPRKFQIA